MNKERDVKIASWIAARARGDISPGEDARLEAWLDESKENRALYARLMDRERLLARLEEYEGRSLDELKKRVQREIARRTMIRRVTRVASLVFLPLLIVGLWLGLERTPRENFSLLDAIPGGGQVVLELADGRQVEIVKGKEVEGVIARNDSACLAYPTGGEPADDAGYNTLLTARGGEYGLMLSDGTRVWLNAESRLRYPVIFDGESREVYLDGEAYFDVARGASPFRVHVRGAIVEALGTSFNVMGYGEEAAVEATLVSGKARVSRGEEAVVLSPGQQARVDMASGEIATRAVNALVHSSWKENLFIFDDESLEVIARKLSRWYDMDIEILSPATRATSFYGVLPKYATITVFLERMQKVYAVEYAVEGRKIVLK
ncbi:MAG: DUF4974 domain-containing protein [Odoribacteraceae bacterium]|jgi:ferric-dicitrate binding protein FerR (iron transport regulator)|nr:DUF4974 domain-containing protein [Odoribacteraceae bacterium]